MVESVRYFGAFMTDLRERQRAPRIALRQVQHVLGHGPAQAPHVDAAVVVLIGAGDRAAGDVRRGGRRFSITARTSVDGNPQLALQ